MAVQSPPSTALYCNAVSGAERARSHRGGGRGGKSVEPVRFEELAALTSEAPPHKVRARRADLMCHFDVLGTAFEHAAVIPLRFGIVFDDEATLVEEFLRPRHAELVKLRVTAHYREEAILAEIVRENARVARLRGESSQPLQIELGELVAAELRARTDRDVRAFDAAMDELASGQAGRIDFKYVGPLPPHSFVSLGRR